MTKDRRNFLKAIATGSVISTSGCVGILAPEVKGKIGQVKIGSVYTINRIGDDKISVEKEGERMKADKGLLGGPDWVFSNYGPGDNNEVEKVIYYYSYKHSVREHVTEPVFATFKNYLRLAEEIQPSVEDTEKLRRDIEDKFLNEPALSKLVSLINELRASGFYAKALEYSDTLSELEQLSTTLGDAPGKFGGGVTKYLNRMPEIYAMLEMIASDDLYDFSKADQRYVGASTGSGYTRGILRRTPEAFVKGLSAIEQLLKDLADLCQAVNSDLSGVNYSSRYGTSTTFLILGKTFAQASKEFYTRYIEDLANATEKLEQVTDVDTDVVYKDSPPI